MYAYIQSHCSTVCMPSVIHCMARTHAYNNSVHNGIHIHAWKLVARIRDLWKMIWNLDPNWDHVKSIYRTRISHEKNKTGSKHLMSIHSHSLFYFLFNANFTMTVNLNVIFACSIFGIEEFGSNQFIWLQSCCDWKRLVQPSHVEFLLNMVEGILHLLHI